MSGGTRFAGGDQTSYAHLLATVRAEKSSSEARQRTLVALGLTAAVAGSLAPAAAKKMALAFWLKLAGSSIAAGAIGLLLWQGLVTRATSQSQVESAAPQRQVAQQQPAVAPASAVEQHPSADAVPVDSLPRIARGPQQGAIPPGAVQSASPKASARGAAEQPAAVGSVLSPADALADEVRALDEVRQSLRAGGAARALALLEQYDKDHRSPVLGNEALVLRIEALMGAGRQDAARAMAADYLRQWPNSPFAPRVRALTGVN